MVEIISSKKPFIVLILIIAGGAGLLAGGYFWGVKSAEEKQKKYLSSGESKQPEKTANGINSKIIKTIVASGEVSNISGQIITLADSGESLDIYINENTRVYSMTIVSDKDGKAVTKQEKAEFSLIKIGDRLTATLKITQDGSFEAVSLNIVPLVNR